MRRGKLSFLCLLAGVLAGSVAGLAGVDPVTSGLVGFGTAGLSFILLSNQGRPR